MVEDSKKQKPIHPSDDPSHNKKRKKTEVATMDLNRVDHGLFRDSRTPYPIDLQSKNVDEQIAKANYQDQLRKYMRDRDLWIKEVNNRTEFINTMPTQDTNLDLSLQPTAPPYDHRYQTGCVREIDFLKNAEEQSRGKGKELVQQETEQANRNPNCYPDLNLSLSTMPHDHHWTGDLREEFHFLYNGDEKNRGKEKDVLQETEQANRNPDLNLSPRDHHRSGDWNFLKNGDEKNRGKGKEVLQETEQANRNPTFHPNLNLSPDDHDSNLLKNGDEKNRGKGKEVRRETEQANRNPNFFQPPTHPQTAYYHTKQGVCTAPVLPVDYHTWQKILSSPQAQLHPILVRSHTTLQPPPPQNGAMPNPNSEQRGDGTSGSFSHGFKFNPNNGRK